MKFISPGGWFSIELPQTWNEFEDTAESFLFYNPEKWDGNFRISAFKDKSDKYAEECIKFELDNNTTATIVNVGNLKCAYSCESFNEEGVWYTTHIWITGEKNTSIECSFTVCKGGDKGVAEQIIKSLVVRDNSKVTKEIIQARLLEIEEINAGFDWAVSTIKKELSRDFTSQESDITSIQKMLDSGKFNVKQKDPWVSFAMAFGAIIINEMDGMDWATVVDGKSEYPVLRFKNTDFIVDPVGIIWGKIKEGNRCNLNEEFDNIAEKISELL